MQVPCYIDVRLYNMEMVGMTSSMLVINRLGINAFVCSRLKEGLTCQKISKCHL
jgi:hypothetical protein